MPAPNDNKHSSLAAIMTTETSTTPIAPDRPAPSPAFLTTHWTAVMAAGRQFTDQDREALARLCENYWFPLYAYVRRRGHAAEQAKDLTQGFFSRLLANNWLESADRSKGRFRTFLLTALSRFLGDEWDKSRAQKRGGGLVPIPLQLDTAETRFGLEPADPVTPEQCFERRWALALLDRVLNRLRSVYEDSGRGEHFAALQPCLVGSRETQPYSELATRLGMTEGAVKVAVHRLRKEYRETLREEIAQTVSSPAEVDDELRHLFAVLSRR